MEATMCWAALYESAAERARKKEREIKLMQERIWQLEREVHEWKTRYLNRSALDARNDQPTESSRQTFERAF